MAGDETSKPREKRKYEFSEHLQVVVGSEKKHFIVHKDVITCRSPFFAAASAERWNNSGDVKPIELPDEDPKIFSTYLQWLYHAEVVVEDKPNNEFSELIKAYIMADKFGDLTCANAIADEIIRSGIIHNCIPTVSDIHTAFEDTPDGSPLRKLLVDFWMFEADDEAFSTRSEFLPYTFLATFFRRHNEVQKGRLSQTVMQVYGASVSQQGKCAYHRHDASHPACGA
ncbi:hypothetical protein LTR37_009661 [Vermiconidia calcicola]|uniref:Uncharacterized protein n=1 Tax=Vermiconidia calcicola TaxID=1690605 RepID=A0ACC3N780_9PEZI|nr:hypothetical protein LTR37_009661 [Vermiconidia calcicola]